MALGQKDRRTNYVSFSGIDGAGKSTQIEALRDSLIENRLEVKMIRFWDDIARLTNLRENTGHKVFKGDKGIGSPEAPIERRDKNVQSWPMTLVRLFIYTVDAFSTRSVVKKALRSGVDLVIFDRYVYDELANLKLGNPLIRLYVRLIMSIVPRPQISYFLDADPVKARARKPEYPLDFLFKNRKSYFDLINLVGGVTVIPPMGIEEVKQAVFGHAQKELSFGPALQNATKTPEPAFATSAPAKIEGR
jgi:thymidylate kinase